MAAWHQDVQKQQRSIQAALSLVQDHVQSSIQACRLKLAQLQQWLMHPIDPRQQEALSRQLQEAEQQLVQFRQESRECELEVQQVAQLSVPLIQDKATKASDLNKAGPALSISSSSTLTPDSGAVEPASTALHGSNSTLPSGASSSIKEGLETQSVGATPHSGWASFNAAGQTRVNSAPEAQNSRGRSLWQPTGRASSSTASVLPQASAVTRLPPR